jgi:hypothetical protein
MQSDQTPIAIAFLSSSSDCLQVYVYVYASYQHARYGLMLYVYSMTCAKLCSNHFKNKSGEYLIRLIIYANQVFLPVRY